MNNDQNVVFRTPCLVFDILILVIVICLRFVICDLEFISSRAELIWLQIR